MQKILFGRDVLVCEGRVNIFERVTLALDQTGASVIRTEGLPVLMQEDLDQRWLAVASVSSVHADDSALVVRRTRGRPVVWIDDRSDAQAAGFSRPDHLLPLDFTPAELSGMLALLAQRSFGARDGRFWTKQFSSDREALPLFHG